MLPQHLLILVSIAPCLAIWPQPAEIRTGHRVLWLDPALHATLRCEEKTIDVYGTANSQGSHLAGVLNGAFGFTQGLMDKLQFAFVTRNSSDQPCFSERSIVQNAVREAIQSIQQSNFVPWKLYKRHSTFEPDPHAARRYISTLHIQQKSCPASEPLSPESYFGGDESYLIDIDDDGITSIKANGSIGTIRGLQTLEQLFFAHSTKSGSYTPFAPLRIADRARWRHRGLSIDIARNPFESQDLLRTIDAMAMAKLNRLHIHATDSQSWPLEIPSLPDLARKGAYQPHLVWSANNLREIQMHGAAKGVSVFIEIDMPGHTASVTYAYPDLVAAFNELDWSTFAAEPLSGQLKLNSSDVHRFVATVLDDLLSRTSPYTSLYHVGGDELNRAAYLLDETVQSDDPGVLQPLLQKFIDSVIEASIRHGMQPVVWEEMLLDWNLTLPSAMDSAPSRQTLVQVWRNSERIEEVLKRGHRAIFGDYHFWYLDCKYLPYNTSGGYSSKLEKPYLDYCNPYHNWRQMYTYNPLANISADLQEGIEGGEVLMWSEQTDSSDLDSKLWPRAAAAAEVLWAGVRQEAMLEDATRRLGEWRERGVMDLRMRMSPVTMTWCLMEGGCNL
ncbi:uncharacterized protein A1O5_03772 [Cladophialophora psammophila CBS 110553]|uniref:Beta-hexosaminidase n=1 Tax=Cladophialophora psammophila CBS 110553 TaxID=1182543 RepID=W9X6S4_9EURO|nr:uncharacterized protein A1O5_03772 [Cladophialophora psammophila CBS 110553]EXJ72626.1 hypothetical protein A1O5_03772 [Cladophialophora psammophila CBS 110553]